MPHKKNMDENNYRQDEMATDNISQLVDLRFPLPWEMEESAHRNPPTAIIYAKDSTPVCRIAGKFAAERAEIIVRAVNEFMTK